MLWHSIFLRKLCVHCVTFILLLYIIANNLHTPLIWIMDITLNIPQSGRAVEKFHSTIMYSFRVFSNQFTINSFNYYLYFSMRWWNCCDIQNDLDCFRKTKLSFLLTDLIWVHDPLLASFFIWSQSSSASFWLLHTGFVRLHQKVSSRKLKSCSSSATEPLQGRIIVLRGREIVELRRILMDVCTPGGWCFWVYFPHGRDFMLPLVLQYFSMKGSSGSTSSTWDQFTTVNDLDTKYSEKRQRRRVQSMRHVLR